MIGLRPAEQRDAEAIADIYAPIVRDTAISFETEPPSAAAMAERIESTLHQRPWLVATDGDEVLGYAYASEHRQRAAGSVSMVSRCHRLHRRIRSPQGCRQPSLQCLDTYVEGPGFPLRLRRDRLAE